jgi:hypothetical protein
MTFNEWIAAVLRIARDRGLSVSTTYPRPGWVTFNWQCANGVGYGSCGAGAEFIYLTTPEAFTWLWNCGPVPEPPEVIGEPWDRHGRYVPRVPAMATMDALNALFQIGAPPSRPGLARYPGAAGGGSGAVSSLAASLSAAAGETGIGAAAAAGKPDKTDKNKPGKGKP